MNKAYYKKAKQAAPKIHEQAIDRVEKILQADGITTSRTAKFTLDTEVGERTYEPDLFCYVAVYSEHKKPYDHHFIVEIDGASHSDITRRGKDTIRDKAFEAHGIPTVRFDQEIGEAIGKFALSDDKIRQRIISQALIPSINKV